MGCGSIRRSSGHMSARPKPIHPNFDRFRRFNAFKRITQNHFETTQRICLQENNTMLKITNFERISLSVCNRKVGLVVPHAIDLDLRLAQWIIEITSSQQTLQCVEHFFTQRCSERSNHLCVTQRQICFQSSRTLRMLTFNSTLSVKALRNIS